MAKKRATILGRCGDVKIGRVGKKYFIETGDGVRSKKRTYKKTKSLAEASFRGRCKRGGLSGFTLSGSGSKMKCRDGNGAFVPVAQCKGPVGRNRAGRFTSLKPL